MPIDCSSIQALRNLIPDTDLLQGTTPELPQNRTARCRENLKAALALTNVLKQTRMTIASLMGRKGGSTTAKRGPDYFRELAAKRNTRAGGRPRKQSPSA
jgi:hypothetical protein